jgi:putative heme-binding domain-containing protein
MAAGTLLAQHTFSSNDVEDGARFYDANCSRCHGPQGDAVTGVDLGHGKFITASTDQDLIKIIRNGIPASGMPPGSFSDFQAETIVAYVRSMSAVEVSKAASGDPVQGKAIFDGKGGCLNCHRVQDHGSVTGPDLTDIGGLRRSPDALEKSLLEPSAEILPQNRFVRLVTQDGTTITGRILNHDTFSVQIMDSKQHLVSLLRSNLKEFTFLDKSPMPSYRDKLSSQEIADVVSYLVSLKGY